MQEEFDDFSFDEVLELVKQFEKMIDEGAYYFFDQEDLEDIIDHFFHLNDKKRSQQALNFALIQHPDATGILLRHAQFLLSENKTEQALGILERVDSLDPGNTDVLMAKGSVYCQMKLFKKAIAAFEAALESTDDPEETLMGIVYELENHSLYDKAIEYLQEVLKINPDNEAALYEIAFCFEFSNKYEDALNFFNNFLDENPYSITAWFNLGLTYNALELYEKAIEAYDFVTAIDETFASAYFNKANSWANMSMYREAIESYRQTFLYEDPDPTTYFYLGECYQKLDLHEMAIGNYQKAIDLDNNMGDAWLEMGVSFNELGQVNDALRCFEKAASTDKDNMEFLFVLAEMYGKTGRFEDAVIAFEKLVHSDYDQANVLLLYSELLYDYDDARGALEMLRKALRKFPKDVFISYRLAAYLFNEGHNKEAVNMLEKALALDFDKHTEIITYAPGMLKLPEVSNLIEIMRPAVVKKKRKRQQ